MLNKLKQGIQQYHKTLKEIAITTLIMGTAWIILGILNNMGIKSKFLFPLNFLTGSLNGMQGGGTIGIIGGILAKFTLILMFVQTFIPIYKENFGKNKKESNVKGVYNKLIDLTKNVFTHGVRLAGFAILGIGIAILIYAFLTVNGNFENSFVIVLALISTLRILLSQTSAVIRFFTTIFRLEHISNMPVYSMFLGLSIGFTISISMSIIFISVFFAYIVGGILSLSGYLMVKRQKIVLRV